MILNNKDIKKAFLISCRPTQWTKNLLIFAAPLFAFDFNSIQIWTTTFLSLIAFCCISSFVYLINDCLDVKSDRLHPSKCKRPIAAGLISIKAALFLSLLLIIFGFVISFFISISFTSVLFLYILIQLAYSIYLKKKPIIDILCISSGFILRAISGGIASNTNISPWFLLSVGLLSLFLAIEKRKTELISSEEQGFISRKVLERYSLPLLLRLENLAATSSFMSYSLWASGPILNGAPTSLMLTTVPLVLTGIFRYQLLSDPKEARRLRKNNPNLTTEKPEIILLKDRGIKLIVFIWLVMIILIGFVEN